MTVVRRLLWFAGSPARMLLLSVIGVYRVTLSGWLGGQCRFYPTCSSYAQTAIRTHGAVRGSAMTAWRIARCGPFTAGGVDHVQPRRGGARYDDVIPTGASR